MSALGPPPEPPDPAAGLPPSPPPVDKLKMEFDPCVPGLPGGPDYLLHLPQLLLEAVV